MTPAPVPGRDVARDLATIRWRARRARGFGLERVATGRSLRRDPPASGRGDSATATADPAAVGLAPVSAGFDPMWTGFYRGVFLADGYPGRRLPDGSVIAHPIYGTYLLADYLRQATETGDARYVDSALKVARAAVARMDDLGGSLVFWYEPRWGMSSLIYDRHYSALTQSYYAVLLRRTGVMAGDRALERAAARTFDSLLVPASGGGVKEEGEHGLAFAEVPTRPTSLVLNGWQSTLHSMWLYADLLGDPDIHELVRRSARTMVRMLPSYDLPELANSRYSLSGHVDVRLRFGTRGTGVRSVRVEVPRCGEHEVRLDGEEPTPWRMYARSKDLAAGRVAGRQLRLNVVLSRVSWPAPNTLHLVVESDRAQPVALQVLSGSYDPRASRPTTRWWRTVAHAEVGPGSQSVALPVPWDAVPWVGYPTSFNKSIEGRTTNVYHGLHVRRLRSLARCTGVGELRTWADTWEAYADRWPTMRLYRGLHAQR